MSTSTRQMAAPEQVVLLDRFGAAVGAADKDTVHSTATPLHLAFSAYVFNPAGELLVTRRALGKKTWPGVWTNSFCGHPAPGEDSGDAVRRRGRQELGITVVDLRLLLPDFSYRATDASGIVENEFCPVYSARCATDPVPNPGEVAECRWVDAAGLRAAVAAAPWAFSPWMALQLPQLEGLVLP
ncbi:isopentenyl-diphosphate Delta-isomerase [Arthrobacter sp. 35W]|uniref:isopentenyl-diphosphate Delta-isomerase n=1 Tax=Arthrobacter sp. 35W TaxID=1132441 RepID=UPI001E5C17C7|nr:isopentenyl-diphosphate Delta-isomerase [Arthrobacter sp. 35W]